MAQDNQQVEQVGELTASQGFQYIGELIAEYMKTLPRPVRLPVIDMVNQSTEVVGRALNEWATMKQKEAEGSKPE